MPNANIKLRCAGRILECVRAAFWLLIGQLSVGMNSVNHLFTNIVSGFIWYTIEENCSNLLKQTQTFVITSTSAKMRATQKKKTFR